MGSELVSDSATHKNRSDSLVAPIYLYSKKFDELFPFYLSIGMTYDQYWNEECTLTKAYLQAYKLNQKRENNRLWLQGMYIYEALCDVSPIMHAFAKKGTKPVPYPSQPYAITEEDVESKKKKEQELRLSKLKATLLAKVKKE